MTPSPSEIFAAHAAAGGWTKEMLAKWGVKWPPDSYVEDGKKRYRFVDQLKAQWRKENLPRVHALDIVAYASRHVKWTRQAKGGYWACCPFHDEKSASFHVRKSEGRFKCFGCGVGGDIVDLCMALERLGMIRAMERLLNAEQAVPTFAVRKQDPNIDAGKRKTAAAIWAATEPLAGTPAETYLRGRGIGCDLAHADLRFHSAAPEGYKLRRGEFAAMVGAIRDPAGTLLGVHLTYLTDAATKRPSVENFPDRRMLGNVTGGFVRLGELGPRIVAGEGVESALSASEVSGLPAIAALNKGNMAVLPHIDGVIEWLVAHDAEALAEAKALSDRLLPTGVSVRFLAPPMACSDWNDASQRRRS